MWSSTVHKSTLQSQKWLGLSHYNLKNNLNAISKTTEWSLFISKANHSISQWSKSMPWPIMLKNLKLALRRPIKPSRTNTPKRCPFHYRGLECKSRKSRNTWSNGQIWPWSTEWNRAKANRVLPREHTGHNKHPLPTTEEKTLHMDITRWSTPKSDWLYFWSQRWRSSIQSVKTRPGADFGSDHELFTAKFRFTLKKARNH